LSSSWRVGGLALCTVVLKELNPALIGDVENLRRFVREGRTLVRLSHPNIVRAEGMFRDRGNHYLVLEYLTGGTLSDWTDRGRKMGLSRTAEIAIALCDALFYLHRSGIVHCDLNPSNVLFDAQGRPKLIDLGIAHIPDNLVHRRWRTQREVGVGTVPYMAPEQLDGVRDDPRIDMYALGMIAYQMLTGRYALDFDLRNTPAAYAANVELVRNGTPYPLTHVPSQVGSVIMRALSKDPDNRYPDMASFRQALIGALFFDKPEPQRVRLGVPFHRVGVRGRIEGTEWPRWVWRTLLAINVTVMVVVALLLIGASTA